MYNIASVDCREEKENVTIQIKPNNLTDREAALVV